MIHVLFLNSTFDKADILWIMLILFIFLLETFNFVFATLSIMNSGRDRNKLIISVLGFFLFPVGIAAYFIKASYPEENTSEWTKQFDTINLERTKENKIVTKTINLINADKAIESENVVKNENENDLIKNDLIENASLVNDEKNNEHTDLFDNLNIDKN